MSVITGLQQQGGLLSSIRFVDENNKDYYIVQAYIGETLVYDSRIFDFRIKSSVLMNYVSSMVLASQAHLKLATPFQIESRSILYRSQSNKALTLHRSFDIPYIGRLYNKHNLLSIFEEKLYLEYRMKLFKNHKIAKIAKVFRINSTMKCFTEHEAATAKYNILFTRSQDLYSEHKPIKYHKQILIDRFCDFMSIKIPAWYADFNIHLKSQNITMYSRSSHNTKMNQVLRFKQKKFLKPKKEFKFSLRNNHILMPSKVDFIAVNEYLQSANHLNFVAKTKFDTDNYKLYYFNYINPDAKVNFILGKVKGCVKDNINFNYKPLISTKYSKIYGYNKLCIKNNTPMQIMIADKIVKHYNFDLDPTVHLSNTEILELHPLENNILNFNICSELSNNTVYSMNGRTNIMLLQESALDIVNEQNNYSLSNIGTITNATISNENINDIKQNSQVSIKYRVPIQNTAGRKMGIIRRLNRIKPKVASLNTEDRIPSHNYLKAKLNTSYRSHLKNEDVKDVKINIPIKTNYFVTFEAIPKTGSMKHIIQVSPFAILNTKVVIIDTITTPVEISHFNIVNALLAKSQVSHKDISMNSVCNFISANDFMNYRALLNFQNNNKLVINKDKDMKQISSQEDIQTNVKLNNIEVLDFRFNTNQNVDVTRNVITKDQLDLYSRNQKISLQTEAAITAHDIDICLRRKNAFVAEHKLRLAAGEGIPTWAKKRFMRLTNKIYLQLGNKITKNSSLYLQKEMLFIAGSKKLTNYIPDLTKMMAKMQMRQTARLQVFGLNDLGLRVKNNILISENLCKIDASILNNIGSKQFIDLIPKITTDMPWTGLSFKVNEILAMKPDTVDMDAWLCPILIDDVLYIRQGYKINPNGNTLEVE